MLQKAATPRKLNVKNFLTVFSAKVYTYNYGSLCLGFVYCMLDYFVHRTLAFKYWVNKPVLAFLGRIFQHY